MTNPISAYITCISLREIIKCLNLEKGFKKQKYEKNINLQNDNNKTIFIKNNSLKKTKRQLNIKFNEVQKK